MTLPDYAAIRRAARHVETGMNRALLAFRQGRVPDEPRLVERILVEVEHEFSGLNLRGLHWAAGTLSAYGKGAAEKRFGADFLGVFEIRLPAFEVTKGFLAQAKLIRTGDDLGAKERRRLREQCEQMLMRTPDAFAFIIRPHNVTIVPAISIAAGDNEPLTLYKRGVQHFFEEHFACFIGDGLLASRDVRVLDKVAELQERYDARRVLYLVASSDLGDMEDRLRNLRGSTDY